MEHTGQSWSRLKGREVAIGEMVIEGFQNPEIAMAMHVSERTVKAYTNRMFTRFGIRGGIKRVKLAVLLYKEDMQQMG